jgi:hypothetical protein
MGHLNYLVSVATGVLILLGILLARGLWPQWEGYLQLIAGISMGSGASSALYIFLYFVARQIGRQ